MLDVENRVVVAHGGGEAALRIVGRGRCHDFHTGHVHEHAVQALRMLGTLAPAFADHRANHQRHVHATSVHVPTLRGDVHELVHREQKEVHANVNVDGPQAGEGHADGGTGHRVFGERRAEDALGAELLQQPAGRALDGFRIVDVEAEDEHVLVARHLLLGSFAHGIDERKRSFRNRRPHAPLEEFAILTRSVRATVTKLRGHPHPPGKCPS